jgi:hypothetical protein
LVIGIALGEGSGRFSIGRNLYLWMFLPSFTRMVNRKANLDIFDISIVVSIHVHRDLSIYWYSAFRRCTQGRKIIEIN